MFIVFRNLTPPSVRHKYIYIRILIFSLFIMFLHCIQHMAVIFLLVFHHFLEFDPSKADVYLYKGIEEVRKVLLVYDTGMCAWKNIFSFYFSFLLLGLFENQKKGYNKREKSKRQADNSKISKTFLNTS